MYPTDAAKDRVIEFRKSTADVIGMSILVGPNWIVNAPEDTLRTVAPTLGGVLMVESAS
ncbi:hypothetical protein [Kineosporia sp. A_224]|uniref:hypothetical protein n=1 Tax=Kineosporia sp. A_224 TaxID=1962180 RepID=UPI001304443C|nr:hypothetical protein [Kineosporia sp. A_224]